MDLLRIMKKVELFQGLNEEQLRSLGQISQKQEFAKSATIFEQDTPGDKMYIVSHGQVEVRVRDPKGQSRAVLYLGEGQVFGEMALIDDGKRSASVHSVEDGTIVYSIPNDDFTKLCKSDTGIGYIMMRNLALDLTFKLRHRDFDPSKS